MMLKLSKISKSFGGVHALKDVSFSIEKGKITALIGPNGSGKTTCFNAISGLIKADKGSITLNGKELSKLPAHKRAQAGIARTFQQVRLFHNLSIKDHLLLGIHKQQGLLKNFFSKEQDHTKHCHELLKKVGLNKHLTTLGSDLSYGQRKLLDLAMALGYEHDLLMLDEPVAGVNPALRKSIKAILKKLRKEGETILLIEHDMNFVMNLADKIIVLDRGQVLAQGTPKQIQNNKAVLNAYLGESKNA